MDEGVELVRAGLLLGGDDAAVGVVGLDEAGGLDTSPVDDGTLMRAGEDEVVAADVVLDGGS